MRGYSSTSLSARNAGPFYGTPPSTHLLRDHRPPLFHQRLFQYNADHRCRATHTLLLARANLSVQNARKGACAAACSWQVQTEEHQWSNRYNSGGVAEEAASPTAHKQKFVPYGAATVWHGKRNSGKRNSARVGRVPGVPSLSLRVLLQNVEDALHQKLLPGWRKMQTVCRRGGRVTSTCLASVSGANLIDAAI
jgi:hypothetical protein